MPRGNKAIPKQTLVTFDAEFNFVQQIFIEEGVKHPLKVFQRTEKRDGLFDYISLPQLFRGKKQSYFFALCLMKCNEDIIHAPVHILMVEDQDNEYEQYLRSEAPQYHYIWDVLMIMYDYMKKYHNNQHNKMHKKMHKKKKKKYLKKGKILAHNHVFTQILWDLGDKIKKNLRWEKYQTSQSNNKRHGQHYVSFSGMDKQTWDMSGYTILNESCLKMNMNGPYIYFSDIPDQIKLFGITLTSERPQGIFEAEHLKLIVNRKTYNVTCWFDMKFIDHKKRPHSERL